jgi:hypothetical protein
MIFDMPGEPTDRSCPENLVSLIIRVVRLGIG